jgi:hypothetical protein
VHRFVQTLHTHASAPQSPSLLQGENQCVLLSDPDEIWVPHERRTTATTVMIALRARRNA